jgi:hypothetical protein
MGRFSWGNSRKQILARSSRRWYDKVKTNLEAGCEDKELVELSL